MWGGMDNEVMQAAGRMGLEAATPTITAWDACLGIAD